MRGFDVRTGKRLWIFHTIPTPGEFGRDTWEKDSASYTGNAGVWGQISADEELGLVYLPVELPTGDYYGGHRPGNGLFGESLVAVDLQTGQRKWHYQLVHHGIWDMDIPCAPILVDVTVNGRTIKAVAQPTKQAFLYVFNRATGEPIWPIEERPVPKGNVPGEWYAPTQPFPTRPPAYDRQGVSTDDLIDFTPELRAEAMKVAERYTLGSIFTPPVVSTLPGPLATLTSGFATNWPGGAYDPETHIAYIYSQSGASPLGLVPPPDGMSDMNYIQGSALTGARRTGGSGSAAGGGRSGEDAPRPRPRRRRLRPRAAPQQRRGLLRARWRRRGRRRAHRAGTAAAQAALRAHQRDRPEQGRNPLAHRARRDARQRAQSSGAEGPDDSAHRTPGPHQSAGHQDAADRRRRRRVHDAIRRSAARCCARTTRRTGTKSVPCTCRRPRADRR